MMMYAATLNYCIKHGIDDTIPQKLRQLADELSDFEVIGTYADFKQIHQRGRLHVIAYSINTPRSE